MANINLGAKAREAERLIEAKMLARGIPRSHWYVAIDPVRLVYLATGANRLGKHRRELKIDRRWSESRLQEWLDSNVDMQTSVDDII